MRPKICDLEAFVAVALNGSFRKASESLGISKPQISRRVAGLEELLNVRLLNRSSNFVTLTPIGVDFSNNVQSILYDIDTAVELIDNAMSQSNGTIRIHTSTTFGTMYLRPAIHEFMELNPGIDIQMHLDDVCDDVLSEEIDFSLRIGQALDSELKVRFFKPVNQSLVCSPDFYSDLRMPFTPDMVPNHECIVFKDTSSTTPWVFNFEGREITKFPKGRIVSNNWEYILAESIDGSGLALVPQFIAKKAIENGSLIELMDVSQLKKLDLFALFPARYIMPLRVRELIDFLGKKWKRPMPAPRLCNGSSSHPVNGKINYEVDEANPAVVL